MRLIARILKSNGTDGEVLMTFLGMDPEEINPKEPVFVEFDGLPVPFFFESFTRRGTGRALVHLTGVRSLADADELAGRDVYVEAPEEEDGEDIIGWTVLDATGATVGTVRDYEDIPGNLCIWVERDSTDKPWNDEKKDAQEKAHEVLLPLHDDLILEINPDTRTIMLEIPDGLL
ncbi:MAG: PRC-barrel domain-containing protein [Bacteroidales bacterium]|nr:PRC-barrel domain-containing protein [Bacteroidales bacterium]